MTFTFLEADRLKRSYVCAQCYADLVMFYGKMRGDYELHCPTHGDIEQESVGRVTRWWAERHGTESVFEKREVARNLDDLFQSKNAGKDEDDLLSELGFGG